MALQDSFLQTRIPFEHVLMSLGGVSTYGVRASNVEFLSLKFRNAFVTEEVCLDGSKELCGRGRRRIRTQARCRIFSASRLVRRLPVNPRIASSRTFYFYFQLL